jgi:GNAT superfamily N-acetyltransferase
MQNEPAANIILPFAQKALDFPRKDDKDQLWIILNDDTSNDVEFVLSCNKGLLGNYPIFVYTPKSSAQLAQEANHIADSLLQLVLCLLREVPPQRVFSVFSIAKVAEKFAEIFEEHTQQKFRALEDPYYDATFTFCTNETLNESSASFSSLPESENLLIALRRADISNLEGIKALCKGFSYTSPPYLLDDERAELEARKLITNRQAWVHMIKRGDEEWETACLVATTRESENVTAVTKVFTADHWRGRGCAARLLHRVCQEIIQNKRRVVLYVGNSTARELTSARKIYHKVGFQGLSTVQELRVENVERWLEIGFEGTTLGYW